MKAIVERISRLKNKTSTFGQITSSIVLTAASLLLGLRTPLYRIQKFKRVPAALRGKWGDRDSTTAALEVFEVDATLDDPMLKIGGCAITDSEARHRYRTKNIPILMYHRVADDGPPGLAPYRVTREMFERQMQFLHRHGYRTVSIDEASKSYEASASPGRLVALTFDDGYRDFLEAAWPILRRYGFSATVYLPTDFVGGSACWDASYGAPAPLLSWDDIRWLHEQGVAFGAHSCSHRLLTSVDRSQWPKELTFCKDLIRSELDHITTSFSYPYGGHNSELRQAVADAGYTHAVATDLKAGSDRFALPRIEVHGSFCVEQFAAILPEPELAPKDRPVELSPAPRPQRPQSLPGLGSVNKVIDGEITG